MKKVLIPLLLVVVLIAVSPWLVGLRAKSAVEDFAQQLNVPPYTVTVESYSRGYMSSQAVVKIAGDVNSLLSDDMTPEQREEAEAMLAFVADGMSLRLDIAHGPLLQTAERSFGLFSADVALTEDPAGLQNMKAAFGVDELLTTRASFGFGGAGEIMLHAPAFTVDRPEIGNLNFGGLDYRIDVQSWGRMIEANGQVHESSGSGPNGSFRLAPLVVRARGERTDDFLIGDATLETEGVSVTGADGGALEGLVVSMNTSSPTPETVDMSYRLSVRRITGGDMEYDLEDLVVQGSMVNVAKAALRELQTRAADPVSAADPAIMAAALDAMFTGAELRIDEVSFRYGPDVALLINGAYSFEPGFLTSMVNTAGGPPDPLQVLGLMHLRMSLDFSQGVVDEVIELVLRSQMEGVAPEATPQQIDQLIELQKLQLTTMLPGLVQSGMLRAGGRGYQADLQFEDGTLTVNGNPLPIPGL